jgi:hypothetical protein
MIETISKTGGNTSFDDEEEEFISKGNRWVKGSIGQDYSSDDAYEKH